MRNTRVSGVIPSADAYFGTTRLHLFSTTLDPSPRVNGKPIDLQKLYHIVLNLGGYDQVSREKLVWRKVGQEFHLGATNAAAYAHALKTVYYKNLA